MDEFREIVADWPQLYSTCATDEKQSLYYQNWSTVLLPTDAAVGVQVVYNGAISLIPRTFCGKGIHGVTIRQLIEFVVKNEAVVGTAEFDATAAMVYLG